MMPDDPSAMDCGGPRHSFERSVRSYGTRNHRKGRRHRNLIMKLRRKHWAMLKERRRRDVR